MQERRILLNTSKVPKDAVGLELPSSVVWTKGNICKDSNI
jgi:hypothetical protein